jgi:hypothetical protein
LHRLTHGVYKFRDLFFEFINDSLGARQVTTMASVFELSALLGRGRRTQVTKLPFKVVGRTLDHFEIAGHNRLPQVGNEFGGLIDEYGDNFMEKLFIALDLR